MENPWRALEAKFGVRAEWVDIEKIEDGGGGDVEGGEEGEVRGEGGDEGGGGMTDSLERVEVLMQGKAEQGES